jgi:hypothetical protein
MVGRDEYVGVTAKILARRAKAVLLENDNGSGWVPRSTIHGADDSALEAVAIGDEVSLRVFEWKAQDAGLI